MSLRTAFCAILATAAVAGAGGPVAAQPSGGAAPAASPAEQPTRRSCFWIRNIRGFRSVDNRTVYVRVSGSDIFALELFAPCPGVDWSHRASLRSRAGNRVCEGRGNALDIWVRQPGRSSRRCSVTNVRRLSASEIGALPRGARP